MVARRLPFSAAMNLRIVVPCVALLSSLSACGGGERSFDGRIEESAAGTVALGLGTRESYRQVPISSAASITGRVLLRHAQADSTTAAVEDSTILPVVDQRTCTDTTPAPTAVAADGSVANALVWVDGIAAGKPLPELRRERVTVENCRLEPRIVAVTSGSTVNVLSRDPVVHDMRFFRENGGDPVTRLLTVDEGQVIPSERIAAEAGIVEARCARHPWLRGYIAVFDHPYFAITDATGAFTIEQLPPGTYTIKVWREGLERPEERRVVITPGGNGRLDLRIGAGLG